MKDLATKLLKASAYERKNGFTNTEGLKFNFSNFVIFEIESCIKNNEAGKYKNELKKLVLDFLKYPDDSISDRRKKVERIYSFIEILEGKRISLPEKEEKEVPKQIKTTSPDLPKPVKDESDISKISVQYIKGIGPKLAENLALADLYTVKDLFSYYPRKHLNYAGRTKIKDCKLEQLVTIWGEIKSVECFTPPNNKNITILTINVSDGTGRIKAGWFYGSANRFMQMQYKKRFPEGAQVLLSGKVKLDKYTKKLAIDKPEVEILGKVEIEENTSIHTDRIVPVYPLTDGLELKWLRKTMKIALDMYSDKIKDPLPIWLKECFNLIELKSAIKEFHFPSDMDFINKARKRLVFDELFYMQLGFSYKRKQEQLYVEGIKLEDDGVYINKFLESLPFKLTGAQERVFKEIKADLNSPKPMRRLVQGDVGSGKTIVALLSILLAVQNNFQGALMAPTEILAEQHYRKFKSWMDPLGLEVSFLSGSQGKKERRESLERIKSGLTHITVGTHALIQEGVEFENLGLVVVDEQHRFGVMQRAELKNKGKNPEILSMTATPIPRTLALSLHGDLDVSVIDELPPGRKPIDTRMLKGKDRAEAWKLLRHEINKGRQAYLVFPLIEESEKLTAKAATVEAERLQKNVFPEYKIGLLHGQMKPSEKEEIMQKFVNRELDILVSTTVIEVGVDVPNATVMIIENAERFGLAQLHQLRGRVGRGGEKSYCLLMSDKPSEISEQRLKIMTETNDGFIISEQDLKIRGPGELLGVRQSGLPDLVLADLINDVQILEQAREAAKLVIEKDNELKFTEHQFMKKELYNYFRNNKDYLND